MKEILNGIGSRLRTAAAGLLVTSFVVVAKADVAVPPRLLNPTSIEEAWNVIHLATANVERLLLEKRLDEVTGQIVLCSPAIRLLAAHGGLPEKREQTDANTALAFSRINLMARESMAGNQVGADNVFTEFKKGLRILEAAFDEASVRGEVFACVDHPESVTIAEGTKCDSCERMRVARRIAYSGIYVKPGEPTILWTLDAETTLERDKAVKLTMKLSGADGSPVGVSDLLATHGAALHLMMVDRGWSDFQHVLPEAGKKPGEYGVKFTPKTDSTYSAWLGVVPVATGLQEYLKEELRGSSDGNSVRGGAGEVVMKTTVEGYTFQISFVGTGNLRAGQTTMMQIQVSDDGGQPVTQLEPLRMAFAHVAGFYEDGGTVLELHPQGADILDESLRSGPILAFEFYPPEVGRIRLFCELKVGGQVLKPAFVVPVEE